jgi:hypothetical protein
MMLIGALRGAASKEENMSSKQKGQGPNKAGSFAKERIVPVAGGNQQSGLGTNRQSDNMRSQGGQYGGAGAQQSGWSARQQAQRMQSRAEEERLGHSRQSGYGGLEQKQTAGNQESTQSGPGGDHRQSSVDQPSSDAGSRHRPDGELDSTR